MSRVRDMVLDLEAIARGLVSARDIDSLGSSLCRSLETMVPFEVCYLMLKGQDGGEPRIVHARGVEPRRWPAIERAAEGGLLGHVFEEGCTTLVPPATPNPEDLEAIGAPNARSLLIQPSSVDGDIVGLIAIASSRAQAFDELDLAVSSFVAKLVGVAWERLQREAELRRRNAVLSTLAQVNDRLLGDKTWEQAVDEVLERLGTVTDVSRAYVFEVHTNKAKRVLCSQRFEWVGAGIQPQLDNPDLQDLPMQEAGFGRWVRLLNKGDRIVGLVRELPRSEQELLAEQDIRSILVVPITARGRWWGFLGFDDCVRERAWTRMEIETIQTAAHALGAAIQAAKARRTMRRARRHAQENSKKLERALEGTVGALLTIMETRDQRLANHQKRVAELALAMAQLMGFDRDRQQATWLAALLHDLGKLSLPFWLVAQGEPEEEGPRRRFRAHVRLGQQVIAPLDLPWPVAEIVGQHHERPDGHGYPLGSKSPSIRKEALIIRVADYVETRATRLEYGDGNNFDAVLLRLERGAGTRFDADAVEACLALFRGAGFFFTTPAKPLENTDELEPSSTPPSTPQT